MPSAQSRTLPPDQLQRELALDASRSILVRAPAGSGKTDLLTRRFLRLLSEVDDPGQIVAITFTKAAAAEMRNRILFELEKASADDTLDPEDDPISMRSFARRALVHSQDRGWNLLDLPAQLRISTIDSFCREIALQQPLLSGLGGNLEISEQPTELYRRAARRTLERIDNGDPWLREALELLLLWRDNHWQDLENQLVAMLAKRDQWMHEFLLSREPDWESLREQLERPFARHIRTHLHGLCRLLDQVPGAQGEALQLARFACEQSGGLLHQELAELAEFPTAPWQLPEELEAARQAWICLANLLLTSNGDLRKRIDKSMGFPSAFPSEKARLTVLIGSLSAVPNFESALAKVRDLPPAHYADEEWEVVKACFTLLRHAAAELRVVFAESAAADFIEVAQIALIALGCGDGAPTDATLAAADRVRHLLVDEFQDTSRRQHQLLAHLIAAWSEREGRTCFVVGDPMQSIYFFREADAELFPRVEKLGLEIPGDQPFPFTSTVLSANFRTQPALVDQINEVFTQIASIDDGSGVTFAAAVPARQHLGAAGSRLEIHSAPNMQLHVDFVPARNNSGANQSETMKKEHEAILKKQIDQIVALIHDNVPKVERARAAGEKYRVAVLGRTRKSLEPIAAALREAAIPFRAIDLEDLKDRPEIIDALALARALLNPEDRVAWLGVLRAPWCGLSLADLHTLTSADNEMFLSCAVPDLLCERIQLLSHDGQVAAGRVQRAVEFAGRLRATQPTFAIGTWLEQVWLQLGGAHCVDAAARANLDLLWKSLDALPQGEPDLLGSALTAALNELKSLPDPSTTSDCGVQMMTIHGAKGLEFEVVIVPDLQAGTNRGKHEMLSWLERGIPAQTDSSDWEDEGDVTEFLVAPFQSKGADRGATKNWVDHIRSDREKQETRRLLYVACTRARDQLHLFARPSYRSEHGLPAELDVPRESLLATAWPAFEAEIRKKFVQWRNGLATTMPTPIDGFAASSESGLPQMPSPIHPIRLRRLSPEFLTAPAPPFSAAPEAPLLGTGQLYERHEGGLLSRALGKAVHSLLQQFAALLNTHSAAGAREALSRSEPRIAAAIRSAGVDPSQSRRLADQALQIALRAADDPMGKWILSPRPDAASEVRWTGVVNGRLRTVQVDRVFLAGRLPQSTDVAPDAAAWWIVDYKTAHEDALDPAAALPELRRLFAPQIEAYAQVLRNLHGASAPVFGGLYYPRMNLFDWWEL